MKRLFPVVIILLVLAWGIISCVPKSTPTLAPAPTTEPTPTPTPVPAPTHEPTPKPIPLPVPESAPTPAHTPIPAKQPHTPTSVDTAQTPLEEAPISGLTVKTLEDLMNYVKGQMPREHSEGFVMPPELIKDDWYSIVKQMLAGYPPGDTTLPLSLSGIYSLTNFIDMDNNQTYWVLIETGDMDNDGVVDKGWGTFILNPEATRELSIQVTHPIYDSGTMLQGISVFKETNSRTFFLAGTHRYANIAPSNCQPSYGQADVAHNTNTLLYTTAEVLLEFYNATIESSIRQDSFTVIQFHGMASDSCPGIDVYLTYGIRAPPTKGERILNLQMNLQKNNTDWVVAVPNDSPPCRLSGGSNIIGRLLNNVEAVNVCNVSASGYSEKFIHIEQKLDYRDPSDWVTTINESFPTLLK